MIERKQGTDTNFIGRSNYNIILYIREYIVQFYDGSNDALTYAKIV